MTRYYSIPKNYYRHSHKYLTAKQVEAIFQASEKAYSQGTPLNSFVTIQYNDHADPKHPQAIVTGILERTRKWLQRRGFPVAYVYTIEKAGEKGIHCHILIHIPKGKQAEYKRTLAGLLPFERVKTTAKAKRIDYPPYGGLHKKNGIYGVLKYICKGIDPAAPVRGIDPRYQGEIHGQRWGISKSLI